MKLREHLAKLEELVIFLLKGSLIILTLPDIFKTLTHVTLQVGFKCSVSWNRRPLCSAELVRSTEW